MINNSETKPTRSLRSLRWPARRREAVLAGKPGGVQLYEIPCRAAHSRGRLPTERESSVERSQRLASQNFRTLANRQRESSADRSQRLASQNARTLANRDRESSAERSQRLASQNSRTLANRDRESSAERSQRLTQQNARSTRNRTRRQHNLLNAAFAYDCTVDYSELNDIDIGRMDKICNLCQAKNGQLKLLDCVVVVAK
ncbi:hypothetical protein EVAR_97114_1 [Eumeta japonica]|uniref:Uncharacterized protein n=1 Tax=Eumeta variegata TaxID=151549 RepID=A0A4C1WQH6_EUMVA|nr:hypothetical protein EVAR_97114_1 [Eumeta japonica]